MRNTVHFSWKPLALATSFLLLAACSHNPLVTPVEVPHPQRAEVYLNTQNTMPLLSSNEQQEQADKFLEKQFTPWDNRRDFRYFDKAKRLSIAKAQQNEIKRLIRNPGWGANFHPHPKEWAIALSQKMNLSQFPNRPYRGIVTRNTYLRVLPTVEPVFNDFRQPGEGYPFDNLQISSLWVGTPLHVSHLSQDGSWALVVSPAAFGWVKTDDIARVNDHFIQQWRQKPFAAITKNRVAIHDQNGRFRFEGRLGMLLPKRNNALLIPVADSDGQANIRQAHAPTFAYQTFPAIATTKQFAGLMNELLGEPYGWGGAYGYRDCSQTMMDFFTPFGIWLPRNSYAQLTMRPHKSIKEMSPDEKEKFLMKNGKPMMTLVGLPGHIALYIGKKDNKPMIFHDMWGLRTNDLFHNVGRGVIGQTVITPLDFGDNISRVDKTLSEGVTTMTYLDQPLITTTR